MQDDPEKISPTKAVLINACDDVSFAAREIMERVGERLDMHVISHNPSFVCRETGEAVEVSMILRFTLPMGQKRSDTDA
jgi:hypothetical protein